MIDVVSPAEVICSSKSALGLPMGLADLDEAYLAFSLRRLAGFLCPCSPRTLLRTMIESHHGLFENVDDFSESIEEAIEALVAIGDLLELEDVALEGEGVKGTWLVAAPPGFVARESGSVFILGLSADDQTPLPTDLLSRLKVHRAIRIIEPEPNENLDVTLSELGLRELSVEAWLKSPKSESPRTLIEKYTTKLAGLPRSGEVPELLVLDWAKSTRSYKRRWAPPGLLTGNFIVRRPQNYGADLWGYAELIEGKVSKLLDLPVQGERWRGCDIAWRIQMAIDDINGRPQEYRKFLLEGGARFDFFSPIPAWARRRLAVVGQEVDAVDCLMSFVVPEREVIEEEKSLREFLFLSNNNG